MKYEKQFNFAFVGKQFENTLSKFGKFLDGSNNKELSIIHHRLEQDLKAYQKDGILKVAFIGQYSAGKSTIISALTGQRDIKIDADIATDKTTSYEWNKIKIIDTPGLFTDRKDHDEVTYEAINKADLLVFCLTYMLFDSLTVENFKKLAYDKGYCWKMMLVINKMSDEAGEEEKKISNYRQSLAEALKPYSLDEFPVCFIDAKDYCEGVDENDDFLLEVSRFPTFIDELNKFVEHRSSLARFDTPVRIALSYVDEVQISLTRDTKNDSAYLEILNQLSRKIRKERERLETKVKTIALQMSSSVAKEGIILAAALGNSKEFENLFKEAESKIQHYHEQASIKVSEIVEIAINSIHNEIQNVLDGTLVQAFAARLNNKQKASAQNSNRTNTGSGFEYESWDGDFERLQEQIDRLKNISKTAEYRATELRKLAINEGTNFSQGFLRASNVAGSNLHHGVYAIGKFLGVDFQPWQAVNIAKDIANVMVFVGPVLGVVSLGMDINAIEKQKEQEQKLSDARREITSQFVKRAKELETQVGEQLREVQTQIYGELEKEITVARQQEEEAIAASHQWMAELIEIRQGFAAIINYIN